MLRKGKFSYGVSSYRVKIGQTVISTRLRNLHNQNKKAGSIDSYQLEPLQASQ
jgi:hypothetical protein